VISGGGTLISDLVENKGFMFVVPCFISSTTAHLTRFSMASNAPSPLSIYAQGRWLEEGRIQVTKTSLNTDRAKSMVRGRSSSGCSGACDSEVDE
jgi:hypothetical protein